MTVADPAVVATYRDARPSVAGQLGDLAAAARLLSVVPTPDAR
jgi:hypothetical protein